MAIEYEKRQKEKEKIIKKSYNMELVFESEWLNVYDNVLEKSYCDQLKEHQSNQLFVQPLKASKDPLKSRTSTVSFVPNDDPIDNIINQKTFELTSIPVEQYEETSVIRYQLNQEYQHHHDYFVPQHPDWEKEMKNGGNRILSAIFILDGNCEGGETHFPFLDDLKIKPKTGRCIIYQNIWLMESVGKVIAKYNERSYHAGLPVTAGEKWIATKWIRSSHMQDSSVANIF